MSRSTDKLLRFIDRHGNVNSSFCPAAIAAVVKWVKKSKALFGKIIDRVRNFPLLLKYDVEMGLYASVKFISHFHIIVEQEGCKIALIITISLWRLCVRRPAAELAAWLYNVCVWSPYIRVSFNSIFCLCEENAGIDYWKELAETRRQALEKALEENEQVYLCGWITNVANMLQLGLITTLIIIKQSQTFKSSLRIFRIHVLTILTPR